MVHQTGLHSIGPFTDDVGKKVVTIGMAVIPADEYIIGRCICSFSCEFDARCSVLRSQPVDGIEFERFRIELVNGSALIGGRHEQRGVLYLFRGIVRDVHGSPFFKRIVGVDRSEDIRIDLLFVCCYLIFGPLFNKGQRSVPFGVVVQYQDAFIQSGVDIERKIFVDDTLSVVDFQTQQVCAYTVESITYICLVGDYLDTLHGVFVLVGGLGLAVSPFVGNGQFAFDLQFVVYELFAKGNVDGCRYFVE